MIKIILSILVLIGITIGFFHWQSKQKEADITTFEECGAAGYPIMESYPAQCRTADGKHFVQDIGNELEKQDLIQLSDPRPGQTITHTVHVTGQARGTWFFEASFPVHLQDSQGNTLVTAVAQAEGEWMTESFVPFSTTLTIPPSFSGKATLVLEKDNPSGLPEHADALRVPVIVE
ncbi:MAG: Gmad2 immunoglobulin-like domain-containing protein [Candidatus Andersenbacteria bacterium]|nr:Gmad2 immunoglobulin-like domain-containing protein [Candidatus Andersenbacteria bacterium]MBI3250397.1 Gmad2 immunoglobulin-like domain-containing protein [Candidatus Andersenbacteria bacterium]